LIAGATSIAHIEKLMEELQAARDYLQSEGERVRRVTDRYAHLAQTASASVKIFAENLGNWRNLETASQAPAAMPRADAPALSPVDDAEPRTSIANLALARMQAKLHTNISPQTDTEV
jgi:hypothetical protein